MSLAQMKAKLLDKYVVDVEAVKLAAVSQNGLAIRDIDNPSEAVQLAAVSQNGYVIGYIYNPSEAVQLVAVSKTYGLVIEYIDNPSEAVQLAAVTEYSRAILHIDNPSEVAKERVLSLAIDDIELYNTISQLDWFKELS
jgi:hypothetical protein